MLHCTPLSFKENLSGCALATNHLWFLIQISSITCQNHPSIWNGWDYCVDDKCWHMPLQMTWYYHAATRKQKTISCTHTKKLSLFSSNCTWHSFFHVWVAPSQIVNLFEEFCWSLTQQNSFQILPDNLGLIYDCQGNFRGKANLAEFLYINSNLIDGLRSWCLVWLPLSILVPGGVIKSRVVGPCPSH